MAGGVYNLVLGADDINDAVSGAFQALRSDEGYTGDININGTGSFDLLNTQFLAAAQNINVTGHLIVNDNITGLGEANFNDFIATGTSLLSNVTGNANFDQITATGSTDLASLINGVNIVGDVSHSGNYTNTGGFGLIGSVNITGNTNITGDASINGTLFVNGTAITGENNLNITITGNGTGGLNFFEEEYQEISSSRGASLIHSTGVGVEGTVANPTSIDFSINAKGNGAYVINSPDVAGHRAGLGNKAIDFQPERDDGALVLEKTYATKGITVGSNNVNYSKEGVIIGNRNTLDIGDDGGAGDYSTYDFIGNFIGGRQNHVENGNEVNVIGANNTGTAFNSAGGVSDSSIVGRYNLISGISTCSISNTFIGGNNNQITGDSATIYNSSAIGRENTVSRHNSTAIGYANIVSGPDSTAVGRENNVSGTDSAAVGRENNVSNTDNIAFGHRNTASGSQSTAIGSENNSSGSKSTAIGDENTASGNKSTAMGVASLANKFGQISLSNCKFDSIGDSQTSIFVSRCLTTNDVETEVFLDNSSERITVANNSAIAFETLIVATQSSSSNSAGYKISGVISNNGGTTALVGSITKSVLGESVATWDATVEADDTNDALVIKVTGTAGNDIRWVATTTTSEVVF